ncbi:hypothetical protein [Marispirochaeta sp.]|uniref:hypothetical protein n=1 Tax=Marispirochaeta sp. TaxID=2038653 RepID=UPI0029C87346|nr:hypothetical protein [Marispirochaeta sp.]
MASARAARMVQRAAEFGINAGPATTDFSAGIKRVNIIRDEASQGFRKWLEDVTDFYPASAGFIDGHTVQGRG